MDSTNGAPDSSGIFVQGNSQALGGFVYGGGCYVQPTVVTPPGFVATEPFPNMSVNVQTHGEGSVKVARIENKTAGVWLKVVYTQENQRIYAGQKVMVHGKQFVQHWAKDIQELDGVKFILVPEKEIMVIDRRVS